MSKLENIASDNVLPVEVSDLEEKRETTNTILMDTSVLNEIRGLQMEGEPDVLSEVITTFLNDTDKIMNDLDNALLQHDVESIRKKTHILKSSSASVGIMVLSDAAKHLESSSETNTAKINTELI